MHVDGKCLCGAVTYEADIDTDKVLVCHCTDCQVHSGSGYRVVAAVEGDSFKLLTGELKAYEKTATSGNRRSLAFCPECGTNIYARAADGGAGLFGLRVGTITQRESLAPRARIWTRSTLPWSTDLTELNTYPEQPDPAALAKLLEH